ncbi:MAG: hypothetical protein KatS3mg061_1190 [Dehalococcoidia bacterium]|nr:MAG: hypothetical protein KatS3mg061_1190 [Dehalococcoidia bacterium]
MPGDPLTLAGGRARALGAQAEVELVWLTHREAPPDQRMGLRLVDEQGKVGAEKWSRPLFATTTTEAWHRNEVVRDIRLLVLPPGQPAGRYRLEVALEPDRWVPLGTLTLGPPPPAVAPPQLVRSATFGNAFALDGLDLRVAGTPASGGVEYDALAPPGARLDLRLVWRLLSDVDLGYTVFVHLIDSLGRRAGQQDNQPGSGFAPTTTWQRGVAVADEYQLQLPRVALPGIYRLELGWYHLASLERLPLGAGPASSLVVARLRVPGPREAVDPTAPTFGGNVALREARLVGEELQLTWQVVHPEEADLHVFVHVLSPRAEASSARLMDRRLRATTRSASGKLARSYARRAPSAHFHRGERLQSGSICRRRGNVWCLQLGRMPWWCAEQLLKAVGDATARQVIGGKFNEDAVAQQDPDVVLANLAGDVGQHFMTVGEPNAEHRVGQGINDRPFNFDGLSFLPYPSCSLSVEAARRVAGQQAGAVSRA